MAEQVAIFIQIILIDLVLAGDNAIIIGMVASQFDASQRKKIIFWGIGAAVVLRIIFTLITAYLLQIEGLRLIGGLLLLYIVYKLYTDVIRDSSDDKKIKIDKKLIKIDLVIEAKITARVISSAERGLPTKSTIFPIIFPDSIEDDECAKDC